MSRNILIASIVLIALALAPADAWSQGCAMCKAVAENEAGGGEDTSVARGLNRGILYLMVIPYIIFLFVFRKRIVRFFKQMRDIYD
jgi:hypothetical protein